MKKLIILLLVPMLFVVCNTCIRLTKRCPPQIHDSVTYIDRIKDSVITVYTKADTMTLLIPIPCPDVNISEENPKSSTSVKIKNNVMTVKTICKEDSLQIVVQELKKELSQQKTITVPGPEVPVKYIPKFYKWLLLIDIIGIILLAGYVYLKIKGLTVKGVLSKLK